MTVLRWSSARKNVVSDHKKSRGPNKVRRGMLLSSVVMISLLLAVVFHSSWANAITFRGWVCPKKYNKDGEPGTLQAFSNMADSEPIESITSELNFYNENEDEFRERLMRKRSDYTFRGVSDCDLELSATEYLPHAELLEMAGFQLSGNF